MNAKRLVLNILSALLSISGAIIFIVPIWYFAETTITNNDAPTTLTTHTINMFDNTTLNKVQETYSIYNHKLNLTFASIFEILVLITFSLAAISLILTLLTGFKKIRNCHKYILVCKAFSIMTIISSLISLISAFIFTSSSVETIAQTNEIEYTLSINITTGIYLFTILEIAAGISNLLSHNLITNNDESN